MTQPANAHLAVLLIDEQPSTVLLWCAPVRVVGHAREDEDIRPLIREVRARLGRIGSDTAMFRRVIHPYNENPPTGQRRFTH